MPHLCSFGCKYTPGVVMHHFPNPDKFPERFRAWVNLVGGKLETSSDYQFYKRKMICDIHFIDDHRNRYKRLNALAVPTLHLHDGPEIQHLILRRISLALSPLGINPALLFL
ncbi:unnamed protein product [Colias eurytheme]|nr:unnamed protein product [Colias eurytheme]